MANLRESLLGIDGIASADFDGENETPTGVRVRLAAGADAEAVGREVQRVLAEHGMRSHMTPPAAESAATTEDEPAPVVAQVRTDVPPPPPGALRAAVGAEVVQLPGLVIEPVRRPIPEAVPAPSEMLAAVAVEETRSGVSVRVSTTTGRVAERSVSAIGPMVDVAIVEAVGSLLTGGDEVEVVAVNDHLVDATEVVLVVAQRGQQGRRSGSAVIAVGRPFAVGLAAWQAVSELV